MKLAYTIAEGRGETNLVLAALAAHLMAGGLRLAGTVQINSDRDDGAKCDMDVRVLPAGPVLRISQDLGKASRGCRLNPSALEQAVSLSSDVLDQGADLLLVNKFGKHEAYGRGFRELIGIALERDIPVLVGVNALNLDAFHDFTSGGAEFIAPELVALNRWAAPLMATQAVAA